MEKSVFKVFFSKEKENNWLNSMGQEGYLLSEINDSKYIFIKSETEKYYYSIEYLDTSPFSNIAEEYFASRKENGVHPLVSSGNWVYFVSSKSNIILNADSYKKNSKVYFWRSLYLFFFALCGATLCGYQAFSVKFLNCIGHVGNGQVDLLSTSDTKGLLSGLLNILKYIANFFLNVLNSYFKVWTNIFGESDAVAVISIIAPLVLLLLIICCFNFDNYVFFSKKEKLLYKENDNDEEGVKNAE